MAVITPQMMSAWLGMEPKAAGIGLQTKVSAALWNVCGSPSSVWEGATRPNQATHLLWFAMGALSLDFTLDNRRLWSGLLPGFAPQIVRAGEQCRSRVYSSMTIMHVYVPHTFLTDVAREAGNDAVELVDPRFAPAPELQDLAATTMRTFSDHDTLARLQIDTLGILWCTHLLRRWSSVRRLDDPRGKLGPWQKKRSLSFLEEHIASDIGLDDIAAHVGLSRFHFNRVFKRTVGVSPHRYLTLRRLEKAKELLESTTSSITAIAARVGYADPDRLGRLFRSEVGVSPTAYRQSRRS